MCSDLLTLIFVKEIIKTEPTVYLLKPMQMQNLVKNVQGQRDSETQAVREVFARGLRRVKALSHAKVPISQRVSQDVLDASRRMRTTSVRM